MNRPRWTQKRAVAEHVGMDLRDIDSYRYQPSRTGSVAVFVIGDRYFCAVSADKKRPELPAWIDWSQKADNYVEHYGWTVFEGSIPA